MQADIIRRFTPKSPKGVGVSVGAALGQGNAQSIVIATLAPQATGIARLRSITREWDMVEDNIGRSKSKAQAEGEYRDPHSRELLCKLR